MREASRHQLQAGARNLVWTVRDVLAKPTTFARALPDYLIVGAQRCGTTSLQELIASHPQVKAPFLRKGIHYFDTGFDRGEPWYRSQFPYRSGHARLTGEASPYYLFHPFVPERIGELIPDVKIIALLRDPIERAISHYKHEVRRGFEELEMQAAFELEDSRLDGEVERMAADPGYVSFAHQHHSYVARGLYPEQLARYRSRFRHADLLVLEAERFWRSPEATLDDVFAFLQIASWSPPHVPHLNATRPSPVPDTVTALLEEKLGGVREQLMGDFGVGESWR